MTKGPSTSGSRRGFRALACLALLAPALAAAQQAETPPPVTTQAAPEARDPAAPEARDPAAPEATEPARPLGPVLAQPGAPSAARPIVTLDREALFRRSAYGQRLQRDLERDSEALAAENRRIEAELIAEEQALTERRSALPPAEFADLAQAFDVKVQAIRDTQDRKARGLQQRLEEGQQRFLSSIGPILADLMRSRQASLLLDANAVLIAIEGVDITESAIAAVDARLGDGGTPGLTAPTPSMRPSPGVMPEGAAPGQ